MSASGPGWMLPIGLAEVRHDLPAAIVDQREHLLARAGVLADGDVQVRDVGLERRRDGAVADVELRAPQRGLRGLQARVKSSTWASSFSARARSFVADSRPAVAARRRVRASSTLSTVTKPRPPSVSTRRK